MHQAHERTYKISDKYQVQVSGLPSMHVTSQEHPNWSVDLSKLNVDEMLAVLSIHGILHKWMGGKIDDLPPSGDASLVVPIPPYIDNDFVTPCRTCEHLPGAGDHCLARYDVTVKPCPLWRSKAVIR